MRFSFHLKRHARVEMQRTIGAKAGTFRLDRYVSDHRPCGKFRNGKIDAALDMQPQSFTDVEVFA
jgi:hypothetical protein